MSDTDAFADFRTDASTLVTALMLYAAAMTSSSAAPTQTIAPVKQPNNTLDWNTFTADQWYGFSAEQWNSFEWFAVAAYMLALIAQDYYAAGAVARAVAELPVTAQHARTITAYQLPPAEGIQ